MSILKNSFYRDSLIARPYCIKIKLREVKQRISCNNLISKEYLLNFNRFHYFSEFPEFCMMMHKKLNDSDQENELKEVFRVFGKDETGEAEILVIFLQE